jgi:hypothetical protein
MQVGTESRTKVIIMLLLAAIGAFLLVRAFTESDNVTAAPSTTPASPAQPARSATQVKRATPNQQAQSLDPTIRLDLLRAVEDIKYEGKGRNIFKAEIDAPPPRPVAVKKLTPEEECRIAPHVGCPGVPVPPPPINLKFFGFANHPGEKKKVFLSQGEDVFIAGEGDTVNRRYRVMHIGVNSVDIKDVLNDNTQTIPLTQG